MSQRDPIHPGNRNIFGDKMYTVKEFCLFVRISTRQYYRLRAAGDGPRVTVLGGRHVISHDETRRWLAAHTERNYYSV
jgi:hypothetical protein